MTSTLLDHLRSTFTPSAVSDLARATGENADATQKALDGLLPAVTAGVANQAQTPDGAATLYRLLNSTPFDSDPSLQQLVDTDAHRQKAAESGNALLRQLYTTRPERLAESTAQYSGVSLGSATTLTGLVMSVLMGYLHQQLTTRNLTQAQLATLLGGESEFVRSALPAALAGGLGWLIGSSPNRPTPVTGVPASTVGQTEPRDDKAAAPWWRWLLYGLGLLLLLLLLTRACNRDETESTTTTGRNDESAGAATDTMASDPDGNEGARATGPEVRVGVDLPGGRRLNVVENSFNDQLAKYLAARNRQPNRVFTFDNLTFETNSARITTEALANVTDLIEILKAYPTMTIRVEGNTDSTGDDATNDPLSNERAEAVKTALVEAGIAASRVSTRGLSSDKPVATNQTEAGRQQNRRIDIIITRV